MTDRFSLIFELIDLSKRLGFWGCEAGRRAALAELHAVAGPAASSFSDLDDLRLTILCNRWRALAEHDPSS